MKRCNRQPVIIIGMHRSGTSLVSRLLEKMGVFWGSTKDHYNESVQFQQLNEQIFSLDNCSWDNVKGLESLLANESRKNRAVANVRSIVDEKFFALFFQASSLLNPCGEIEGLWGFKDPKSTYTLPVLLSIFPGAKIIHVVRNGIDVAASLWRRETTRPEGIEHPHYSSLCQELEGCLLLWNCYVKRALAYEKNDVDIYHLFFEDLLDTPQEHLVSLAEYLKIPVKGGSKEFTSLIDMSRRYAFISDVELSAFVEKAQRDPLMIELYKKRFISLLAN